jgi:hypothetical protein
MQLAAAVAAACLHVLHDNVTPDHSAPLCTAATALSPWLVRVQVQALRSVEQYLQLEKLYVLGTNCVDNGPRQGLDKFLRAASTTPGVRYHLPCP